MSSVSYIAIKADQLITYKGESSMGHSRLIHGIEGALLRV